jgi:hypothetical protein
MADEADRGRYLTRQDLEAVIQRAVELETETGSAVPELSEQDVLRIAGEVGLSEANVRRALAEHQAGGGGDLLVERGWITGLCGSGLVETKRQVLRPADEVRLELESHFQANESLRLVRRTSSASLWEPDRGIVASVMRGLDVFGRGYQLAKNSQAVELDVVPLSDESCQVSLTTDLGSQRAGWFWGLGVGAGVPLAALASVVVVEVSELPNLLAVLSPGILGVTVSFARAGYRRSVEKMRLTLDGLLDRIEHDEPLEPPRPAWRDLLK